MSRPARRAAPAPDPEPNAEPEPDAEPAPPQRRVTFDEYLAFEEAHPLRHEFIDGYVYAMSGASDPHHRIVANVSGHLWTAARGPCRAYAQGAKLRVADRMFYPDVMVVCEPGGEDDKMAYAPCLLVEVLSRSTALKDRTVKHAAYTSLPSLRAYWIVSQTWRSVERHWRGDDGAWHTDAVEGDGALDVPCPARGALTLDEIYEGLDLPRTPPGGPIRRVKEPPPEYAGAPPNGTVDATLRAARRLLLLSNSRDADGRYLVQCRDALAAHLAGAREVAFVPYAGVAAPWDGYAEKVAAALAPLGIRVRGVHAVDDPAALVRDAAAVAVGGGNTFHLLAELQRRGLVGALRARVREGAPYVGWSAGSVVACPTIRTTNDMPIVEPPHGLAALGLVGFQINAHFTDAHPPGFQGETRRERLAEFVAANPGVPVVGLPEGSWVEARGATVAVGGAHAALVFRAGAEVEEVAVGASLAGHEAAAR